MSKRFGKNNGKSHANELSAVQKQCLSIVFSVFPNLSEQEVKDFCVSAKWDLTKLQEAIADKLDYEKPQNEWNETGSKDKRKTGSNTQTANKNVKGTYTKKPTDSKGGKFDKRDPKTQRPAKKDDKKGSKKTEKKEAPKPAVPTTSWAQIAARPKVVPGKVTDSTADKVDEEANTQTETVNTDSILGSVETAPATWPITKDAPVEEAATETATEQVEAVPEPAVEAATEPAVEAVAEPEAAVEAVAVPEPVTEAAAPVTTTPTIVAPRDPVLVFNKNTNASFGNYVFGAPAPAPVQPVAVDAPAQSVEPVAVTAPVTEEPAVQPAVVQQQAPQQQAAPIAPPQHHHQAPPQHHQAPPQHHQAPPPHHHMGGYPHEHDEEYVHYDDQEAVYDDYSYGGYYNRRYMRPQQPYRVQPVKSSAYNPYHSQMAQQPRGTDENNKRPNKHSPTSGPQPSAYEPNAYMQQQMPRRQVPVQNNYYGKSTYNKSNMSYPNAVPNSKLKPNPYQYNNMVGNYAYNPMMYRQQPPYHAYYPETGMEEEYSQTPVSDQMDWDDKKDRRFEQNHQSYGSYGGYTNPYNYRN